MEVDFATAASVCHYSCFHFSFFLQTSAAKLDDSRLFQILLQSATYVWNVLSSQDSLGNISGVAYAELYFWGGGHNKKKEREDIVRRD